MNSAFLSLNNYLKGLHLKEEAITDILTCFSVKSYLQGDYYARVGERQDKLGFVVNGIFGMIIEKPGEAIFVKEFLQPGDFLLASFEPGTNNLVHIKALHESLVLEARHSDILSLYVRHDDFRQLSERGTQRRYQAICDRLEQRVTLDAAGRYELFRQTFGHLEDEIPQYMVAAYIGVTPTQLSRIRRKEKIA